MPPNLLGILPFEMAGVAVRPSLRGHLNGFRTDHAFGLQLQLLDDHQQFSSLPPQGSARAAALAAMLEKAKPGVTERGRSVSGGRFRAVEELIEHIAPP
jgi:hypothetical protein